MKKLLLFFFICAQLFCQDPGCSEEFPKRCPNKHDSDVPICKISYVECEAFEGCKNTSFPYLCSNGECAENFLECKEKYTTCSASKFNKCIDGLCRENCEEIKYSSCPTDKPIRCPDGSCQNLEVRCASEKCPADQPYLCPDSSCKGSFFLCEYPQNIKVIKSSFIQTKSESEVYYLNDQENKHSLSFQANEQFDMNIQGIALSQIQDSKLFYDKKNENIFNAFFQKNGDELKPFQFIRSVIFNVEILKSYQNTDPKEKHKKQLNQPILIDIKVDYVHSNDSFDRFKRQNIYCLGILEGSTWKCNQINDDKNFQKILQYKIFSNGIYAVIFNPNPRNLEFRKEVYCGLICYDRRLTFLFLIIGLPLIAFSMYVMFKIYQKKLQEENLTTKRIFIEKKMKEIENVNVDFAGQTILEKIEEGVQYFVNPIRKDKEEDLEELKVLNQKLEKLRAIKKEQMKNKKDLIYKNKKKIEKIRMLREDIDNLEEED